MTPPRMGESLPHCPLAGAEPLVGACGAGYVSGVAVVGPLLPGVAFAAYWGSPSPIVPSPGRSPGSASAVPGTYRVVAVVGPLIRVVVGCLLA